MTTGVPIINRITFDFVTLDEIPKRKLDRLANEARQNFLMAVYDEEEVQAGIIKDADLEFEIGVPQGHMHFSTRRQACDSNEGNCYAHALDQVHPVEQEV